LLLLTGCTSKSGSQSSQPSTTDSIAAETPAAELDTVTIISNAIADYLKGNQSACVMTEAAQKDLFESSWPEVQCSVEGTLDSPASFKDLSVTNIAPGKYKYECTCPDHGDKYTDCYTITASLAPDGTVQLDHVILDEE